MQQGLWEPHSNVPHMCTCVKTTGIMINITLRTSEMKFFFKYLLFYWEKKPLPAPRWPVCPWLCREAVHGAKTGGPPCSDYFFIPSLACGQGLRLHQQQCSAGGICALETGLAFCFPSGEFFPASLCRADWLCTAWHTAGPLQEQLSSRETPPLLLPS